MLLTIRRSHRRKATLRTAEHLPERLEKNPSYGGGVYHLIDVVAAREEAARLLGTASDRWDHVVGVAAAARAIIDVVPPEDGDLLIAAAWLHDIGYSSAIAENGFHPVDGARHLRAIGAPPRLCILVAHHSAALVEAKVRHMRAMLLAEFPPEDSIVADALTFADMTTSPTGQTVTVEERLAEILERYPASDPVHRAVKESADQLRAAVTRVEARLEVRQPR